LGAPSAARDRLKTTTLGSAIRYTLGIWSRLTLFLEDPEIWLDNNRTERGLRGPVIGRRNHFGSKSARGTVVAVDYISRPRARFEATLDDNTAKLALVWFNGAYLRKLIHPGKLIRVRGKVRFFHGIPQMANPKWEEIDEQSDRVKDATFRPIYPASVKLNSDAIARVVRDNLEDALQGVKEWFEPPLLKKRDLIGRVDAYRLIHSPANLEEASRARRRLVYDELILLQLALAMSKRQRNGRISAPAMRITIASSPLTSAMSSVTDARSTPVDGAVRRIPTSRLTT